MMGAGNPGVSYTRGPQPLSCVPLLGLEPFRIGLQNWRTSMRVHPHSRKQRVIVCVPTPFVQAAGVHVHCLSKWSCVCMEDSSLPSPADPQSQTSWGTLLYTTKQQFPIFLAPGICSGGGGKGRGFFSCMQPQP